MFIKIIQCFKNVSLKTQNMIECKNEDIVPIQWIPVKNWSNTKVLVAWKSIPELGNQSSENCW